MCLLAGLFYFYFSLAAGLYKDLLIVGFFIFIFYKLMSAGLDCLFLLSSLLFLLYFFPIAAFSVGFVAGLNLFIGFAAFHWAQFALWS